MYNDFAKIYDRFQEIDYDEFVVFYKKIFEQNNLTPETVIDLGCGSGEISLRLAKSGYNTVGIDISEDMLAIAQDKAFEQGIKILFLNQDMTGFEYPEKADAVISTLDCINYLTEYEDMVRTFKCVNETLADNGLFIFDINSEYKLSRVLGNNTFVYEDDEAYCVWDCGYYPEDRICGFDLNFFVKEGKKQNSTYERYFEYQEERAYSADELKSALNTAGLKLLNIYADLEFIEPSEKSERLFFVCARDM